MLRIILYLIPIEGRPRFTNGIIIKTDPSLPPTANKDLVESTSLCIFCVVAVSIALASKRINRCLGSNIARHLRITQLNPILLLRLGMTVVAVTPTYGTIRFVGKAVFFGGISTFYLVLRPNHLLALIFYLL